MAFDILSTSNFYPIDKSIVMVFIELKIFRIKIHGLVIKNPISIYFEGILFGFNPLQELQKLIFGQYVFCIYPILQLYTVELLEGDSVKGINTVFNCLHLEKGPIKRLR